MLRVRFAPSPTGYLHIGSARTFIFNWLYARRHGGTIILRIDDTDLERNTEASLQSIFDGLNWLELGWDEQYQQSERLALHRQLADAILVKGLAYRDFTPMELEDLEEAHAGGQWLSNAGQREISREESDRRAATGEKFALRFRVPQDTGDFVRFQDLVYGEQSKSAAGAKLPEFAHLPLLVAPDGSKLSKRRHGAVVSVTTYRDAGFLPQAYINFLCLLGWSPKDNREQMSREELTEAFSFEGVNRTNAVVKFTEENRIDPKALWLNSQHLRTMDPDRLSRYVKPELERAGLSIPFGEDWLRSTIDLLRARFFTLYDFVTRGRPRFAGDPPMESGALKNLAKPRVRPGLREFAERLAEKLSLSAGVLINGARAALTGQAVGPGAFHVFTGIGRDRAIARLRTV